VSETVDDDRDVTEGERDVLRIFDFDFKILKPNEQPARRFAPCERQTLKIQTLFPFFCFVCICFLFLFLLKTNRLNLKYSLSVSVGKHSNKTI